MSYSQHHTRPVLLFATLLCMLCIGLFSHVPEAFAKQYAMPQVDIRAEIEPDGTLHVTEERTFSFDGAFTCVWWEFSDLTKERALDVKTVSVRFPNDPIPEYQRLSEVAFDTQWRYSGGPGPLLYSVDTERNATYVFFEARDTDMVVQFDYSISNAANVYADCAELYWKFIGPDWAESSSNITCTIELPSNGQAGIPGDTVRAWGHGPLDGRVSFNTAGTSVTFEIPRVLSGEFAEARIVFPVEWVSKVNAENKKDSKELNRILKEEQKEANKANLARIISLATMGIFALLSLGGLIWGIVSFFRHGREHKPSFADTYWRDVPNKEVHPAVIGRLMRWNKAENADMVATVLHLANLGALSINKGTYEEPGIFGMSKTVEDYYLTVNNEVAKSLTNNIDTNMLDFLFRSIARNGESLWLSEISLWGKKHPKTFASKVNTWQNRVAKQVKEQNYFEEQGDRARTRTIVAAIGLFLVGLIASGFLQSLIPLLFTLPASVFMVAFGIFMPRRSQHGADDYARALGLKKWLSDFTLLDERIPADVKVWGEFMVYAQLFGVAKKVIRELRKLAPEMFVVSDQYSTSNPSYVPWDSWYVDDHVSSAAAGSFEHAFDKIMSHTISSVRAANAIAEAKEIGDGWSFGDGGGGGFSSGGGGGFSGGGGGAR